MEAFEAPDFYDESLLTEGVMIRDMVRLGR